MSCCPNDAGSGARFDCQKHRIQMAAAGARCKDPELYCKFRSACLIHFLERERNRQGKKENSTGMPPIVPE
jgi:hypothetical protein